MEILSYCKVVWIQELKTHTCEQRVIINNIWKSMDFWAHNHMGQYWIQAYSTALLMPEGIKSILIIYGSVAKQEGAENASWELRNLKTKSLKM